MATLHIHLDEAGDWNFGPKGSKYFVIAAAWTWNPGPLAKALTALRFSLIRGGQSIEGFHAAPDQQTTRNVVVQTLVSETDWRFAGVVMEKCKINPVLYDPTKFYPKFAGALLKFILRGGSARSSTNVLVYADTLPLGTRKKREGVLKTVKTLCSSELRNDCPHHVFSHCHQSNAWIQAVDYCCWAIQRKWERSDTLTYDQLRSRLASTELNITSMGDGKRYY